MSDDDDDDKYLALMFHHFWDTNDRSVIIKC